jgi:hyperosmotically inducible periplasmic protein
MLQSLFTSKTSRVRFTASVCAVLVLPLIVACQRGDDSRTVGQKVDSAIAKTEGAAADAKASASASVDSAAAAIREGAEQTKIAAQQANAKIDFNADDAAITASVSAGLMKDPDLSALKIDVDTKGGVVSLYGPAPNEVARTRATTIARAVKGVTAVENKLTVKSS